MSALSLQPPQQGAGGGVAGKVGPKKEEQWMAWLCWGDRGLMQTQLRSLSFPNLFSLLIGLQNKIKTNNKYPPSSHVNYALLFSAYNFRW